MAAGDIPATPSEGSPPRAGRRPWLAWVLVLVLFPLLGWEFVAHRQHEKAVNDVVEKIGEPPDPDSKRGQKSDVVKALVGGKTPQVVDVSNRNLANGAKKVEIYRWFSINPFSKRELYVYYSGGEDPIVVGATQIEDTQTPFGR